MLLALALPESSPEVLAMLALAERNGLLLELRARSFGRAMEGTGECPDCGVRLEFLLDAPTLASGLGEQNAKSLEALDDAPMRPANTQDLLACATAPSEEEACWILLGRSTQTSVEALRSLPTQALEKLRQQFERLNAAAEIQVGLRCEACGARPELDLDIAHYLIREVAQGARRLLGEIHELASAYGWSERAIVRMSHERRAAYLELLHA